VDTIHLVANPIGNDSRIHALSRAEMERKESGVAAPTDALRTPSGAPASLAE
jgi:hypothetical protein